MGLGTCARGSDKWPRRPAFCAFPTGAQRTKKNVPTGQTGGGKLTRRKHSFRVASRNNARTGRSDLGGLRLNPELEHLAKINAAWRREHARAGSGCRHCRWLPASDYRRTGAVSRADAETVRKPYSCQAQLGRSRCSGWPTGDANPIWHRPLEAPSLGVDDGPDGDRGSVRQRARRPGRRLRSSSKLARKRPRRCRHRAVRSSFAQTSLAWPHRIAPITRAARSRHRRDSASTTPVRVR
jgi:hypothetical protein